MTLAQAIASSVTHKRVSTTRIVRPLGYATGVRLSHFRKVFQDPSQWNCADLALYYAKVFYSVFGYTYYPSWPRDAAVAKMLLDQWGSMADAKIAIQLYFSNLADFVPVTMGGITSQYSRNTINRCWETEVPPIVKVLDKKVFAGWL